MIAYPIGYLTGNPMPYPKGYPNRGRIPRPGPYRPVPKSSSGEARTHRHLGDVAQSMPIGAPSQSRSASMHAFDRSDS